MPTKSRKRMLVFGLDCAEPKLVFDKLKDRVPTLTRLAADGQWGNLRSTVPPITIPAWISMFTGLDPGQLGLYGFRNRKDFQYGPLGLANARSVSAPRVWDRLSDVGLTSYVLGVPGTYPPWPFKGRLVASFMTPSNESAYTHPPELKQQVESLADGYMLDVEGFRTEKKSWLLTQVRLMTDKRFRVAHSWAGESEWDLMIVVEMGPDRIHHGFWRYFDPDHRLYEPGNEFESAIPDYYAQLDQHIARIIEAAGPDVAVMAVSDHGARPMEGGFRVNEWLIDQGDLVLKTRPEQPGRLTPEMIDWSKTRAWGEGGYYGRVFLNVEGREPQGIIPQAEHQAFRSDLAARLEATVDEDGNPIGTRVLWPEREYREVNNIAPDLIVYFGDLAWRSIGEVGTGSIHARGNDTGPDDANHAQDGILIYSAPGQTQTGRKDRSILDVNSMILSYFGL